LKRALTHASANANRSNERLEFLGDRVLGLVAAEKLHDLYPDDTEGALALKFNALARREACAKAAEVAGISEHLILASAEAGSGGRKRKPPKSRVFRSISFSPARKPEAAGARRRRFSPVPAKR
jgi:ribonuclease-3